MSCVCLYHPAKIFLYSGGTGDIDIPALLSNHIVPFVCFSGYNCENYNPCGDVVEPKKVKSTSYSEVGNSVVH